CRVWASAPRCRVVPSVTLGTGVINSPVLGAGSVCKRTVLSWGEAELIVCPLVCFIRARPATPLEIKIAAGINIQYHHVVPPGLYLLTRIEMTAKATPIAKARTALSNDGSPLRLRRKPNSSHAAAGSDGSLPSKACDTRLILAPQFLQKL